jgi:hypothetical protein
MSVPETVGPRIQPENIDCQLLWQYLETRGPELKVTMLQVATLLIGFVRSIPCTI